MENTTNAKKPEGLLEDFIKSVLFPLLGNSFKNEEKEKSEKEKETTFQKVREKVNNDTLAPETNVFINVYMQPKRKGIIKRILGLFW